MKSLPGLVFLLAPDGRFLRWNEKVEATIGGSSRRLAHSTLFEFITEDDKDRLAESLNAVLAIRDAEIQVEAHFVGAAATNPHLFSLRQIDLAGRICVIGAGLDITRRRSAELTRDRLFHLSPELFCIVGFDGFFKELNPAWEKTLG